jgi:hypothetical protein
MNHAKRSSTGHDVKAKKAEADKRKAAATAATTYATDTKPNDGTKPPTKT